jgi:hypothetical protein
MVYIVALRTVFAEIKQDQILHPQHSNYRSLATGISEWKVRQSTGSRISRIWPFVFLLGHNSSHEQPDVCVKNLQCSWVRVVVSKTNSVLPLATRPCACIALLLISGSQGKF